MAITTLAGANFTQANLTGAQLAYDLNLTNANFSQANLTNANLFGAKLAGANFTGANIHGADFSRELFSSNGMTTAQLYSTASYQAHDLTGINFQYNDNLSNANFAGQNLTGANLAGFSLTGANFTGAQVQGVDFSVRLGNNLIGPGISSTQLYSTASYQAHDLTGIRFNENNLSGWDFAGQNLANARLYSVNLTNADLNHANLSNVYFGLAHLAGANFAGAEVQGANFAFSDLTLAQLYTTASYLAHDLTGVVLPDRSDLSGQAFAGFNLTNTGFSRAVLTGVDFTGAQVRGAGFFDTHLTSAQLYSTASYQAHDLTGIGLGANDLTGWNFAGQNLANGDLSYANLTGADLRQANLVNVGFYQATLTATDLTGADMRGATYLDLPGSAITTNLIRTNGHIVGLDLGAGAELAVRDYDGNPNAYPGPIDPIPITVESYLAMGAGSILRTVFEADAWDSTISFAPGISVSRGGTLELSFASDVTLSTQIGRTFDLFDWTGVAPTDTFTVSSPYVWDLSNLYTTGEVSFLAAAGLPGDFNNDGNVNSADFVVWRKGLGTAYSQAAYDVWRSHFGASLGSGSGAAGYPLGASAESLSAAVPEPSSFTLGGVAMLGFFAARRPTRRAACG